MTPDPHSQRLDLDLGNGFSLALTGNDGTYGLRVLRENRDGTKTFITPNTALSEFDVASMGQLLRVFAASHRGQPFWFADDRQEESSQEGGNLAQVVANVFA